MGYFARVTCAECGLCVAVDVLPYAEGTFGVMTLFGCMPPLMAWSNRYGTLAASRENDGGGGGGGGGMEVGHMVPGGKLVLGGLFSFAALVVVGETVEKMMMAFGN